MIRLLRYLLLCGLFLICGSLLTSAQTADFSISPASGCTPLVVSFTDQSTGAITSYNWNLGNSVSSTLQNPSTTYTAPGNYPVTLTVTGPGGTATKTANVIVYDKPTASFVATSPLAGCTPHNVQFNSTVVANSPGTVTYSWDFGDGTTGTGANPTHTYTTAGTYSVLLTVTNGAGCVQTVLQNAYIIARPVAPARFTANQNFFCSLPAVATFTNISTGGTAPYTASWDFGDGGKGTGNSISHSYTTSGNFTVTLINTDVYGCADTFVNSNLITVVGAQPNFIAPAAVCKWTKATFTNSTPGYNSTSWDFGDGNVDLFSNSTSHAYLYDGTYTVTMTTVVNGCTKTVSKAIQVDPKPTSTVSMNPPVPCPPPVTVSFSANSIVPTTTNYDWTWASGGTASGSTVSKFYPRKTPNNYYQDVVTLITTSAAGCKDTIRIDTVYIRDILVGVLPGGGVCRKDGYADCFPLTTGFLIQRLKSNLAPNPAPVCDPLDYPYDANSWRWDFGDGSPISTLATPSHTYPVAGNFLVKAVVTTPNGCIDSGYTRIHADTNVPPSFFASPLDVCQNTFIKYQNTTPNILANTKFKWNVVPFGNKLADSTIKDLDSGNAYTMIRETGTYSVFLYSDHRGCVDSAYYIGYIRVHPPDAHFTDSIFCAPNNKTVKFINTSDSATSCYWLFGDGDTSTAFNPVHTYPALGLYKATLIVHNSNYNCFDTLTKPIQLFSPKLDFTVRDSVLCPGQVVEFLPSYVGFGKPLCAFYTDSMWSSFDTFGMVYFRYPDRGYKDVTLYVKTTDYCIDSLTKHNFVLVSQPGIHYRILPPIGCLPLNVTFRDSSDNVPGVQNTKWKWAFGDGDTVLAKQASTTHLYTNIGKYKVQLVVTDTNGCESDLLTGYDSLSVHKPKAFYTVNDTSVCTKELVTFTDSSPTARWLRHDWAFGDGTKDTGVITHHGYVQPGRYNIRLIVTDTVGCTDTLNTWYVNVTGPQAAFTMSDTLGICPPLLVRFNNLSSRASAYRWDFGTGGATSVVTSPVSTFSKPGVFGISLVAIDAFGCADTAFDTVRVLGYGGAFTYAPLTGCAPLNVTFSTPLNGIAQITWDYGDGVTNTTTATSTSHTYLSAGPIMPKVIFSDGATCVSSSTGLDTIHIDKVNADFGWSVPCVGTAFTLNDSSTARYTAPNSWAWYFGGTDTSAGTPVTHTFNTTGNHTIILVAANATGCKDTLSKTVFVNDLPKIDVTNDTAICPGDPVKLMATGGLNYAWSPSPDSMKNCPVCDIAFVHLSDPTPGAFDYFIVRGTDANGCVNSDSTKVTIQLKTTSSTGAGGEICVGESFRLHAEGAQKYEWIPKETLDSPYIASPLATPQRTTTYIVIAQEGTCLVDSERVQVIVHSAPVFSAGNDEVIALGGAVTLKPTKSGISRIEWVPDTTLTCYDCFNPTAHPYFTRTYYATAYNEFGCSATDSITVFVRCNGSLVFIPNTFTPNGDGKNDYFFPRGEGIDKINEFRIFDRWGEIVFERSNISLNDERSGWDGRFMGKELPPDVYVYYMQANCSTGEVVKWKGDVTLIR
jgi:gliding motility-associated-like protein